MTNKKETSKDIAATQETLEDDGAVIQDIEAGMDIDVDDNAGVWLEIDGENIVGVHSYRCQSDLTWVKYEGEEDVMPGSLWKNNKVVLPKEGSSIEDIKAAATAYINEVYPVWKQLNIMREGDKNKIEQMGQFIDAVRAWSKKPGAKIANLNKIHP